MARHVRKGDNVIITAGNDRGKTGKILRVIVEEDRVVVEGINVRKKHLRRSEMNPQGGVIEKEMPIHLSNVSPVDNKGKATRVKFENKADGSKVRLAVSTGEQLGPELRKARK
ncbi:50S ribosomal protein L24 [Poriferisphaera sp. WC338]|uniref:50S ribosomal protein L24 n=1 Tax=Poriferisphaera sp. WC338 TaxID=3425129 RepID=UPI003D8172E4